MYCYVTLVYVVDRTSREAWWCRQTWCDLMILFHKDFSLFCGVVAVLVTENMVELCLAQAIACISL